MSLLGTDIISAYTDGSQFQNEHMNTEQFQNTPQNGTQQQQQQQEQPPFLACCIRLPSEWLTHSNHKADFWLSL